ncbi:O-methyltransferase-like protein [Candidatus Thiomargarita nelsonii]|uniref:O-methyltransferase-like protein n=1 Tax=Candidatus Thiomargarita nelsonii TaxID=1003181 RepID=A0A176RWS5_9GAMM|nr:O-methyltransferase-like protein [Candidatus Thiomargarita nelsonii]
MNIINYLRKLARNLGVGRALYKLRTMSIFIAKNYSPVAIRKRITVGNKYWVLAGNAIEKGALHKQYELAAMFSQVERLKPKSILEIGLSVGGTFEVWSRLASEEFIMVGVDLEVPQLLEQSFPALSSGQKLEIVIGDSHSLDTFEKVKAKFPNGVDFLFIDGDHSYNGVKQDYEMYSQLVNQGGRIMLHDINPDWHQLYGQDCIEDSGQVYQFWQEVKKQRVKTEEVIDKAGQSGYGIGIVSL